MDPKKPWQSKTILLNAATTIIGALATLGIPTIPTIDSWMHNNSGMVLLGLGVIGMALRLITKDKISIE